jgi:hypothetical protein
MSTKASQPAELLVLVQEVMSVPNFKVNFFSWEKKKENSERKKASSQQNFCVCLL